MTESRSRQLKALFDEALTLPAERRVDFVAQLRGENAGLAAELESLLTAHTHSDGLEDAIAEAAGSLLAHDEEPDDLVAGRRIGAYRVVAELGRGGMGCVYLAERDDEQYAGRVAIKLLAAGAGGSAGRFRNESQALADLQHPNIAQLLDAGETDDGRPYLVIEYVEGEPIDAYCDARQLSPEARIRLFIKLCDAVEHAHRNLVVHRDIKATNVLVTGDGEPKLLDFGIAKLLDIERARTLELHLTGDVSRLLTPATASPEQLGGAPVTTATDVYALGHLLFTLLSGAVPYQVDTGDRFALMRAILGDEPSRLSAAARANPDAAAARGTTTERLARRLTGDLDAIVSKSLRKKPEERYRAPRELAEDLERHLRHQPVNARGEALGYVTRRFIVRNRGPLAVGAAVVALVASLVTFYTIELADERDRAQVEARRAEEVATFLTNLFEVATPDESRGAVVTAREVLDRGAERIGFELRDEPAVQASLMRVIGSSYGKLGLYENATTTLENALAAREAIGGSADAMLGDALHDLGAVLLAQARYPEADATLERALGVRRRVLGSVHADIAATLRAQAALAQELADYERAAAHLEEAEAIVLELEPAAPLALADVLLARADLSRQLGDYEAATASLEQAIALRTEISGPDHPATLVARNTLADTLNGAGRRGEAESVLREILEIRRRVLPPGHTDIAQALTTLATSIKLQGRPQEAEPMQAEALTIFRAAHSGDHPDVAVAFNNLANLHHDLGDLDGALELHEASLEMHRRLYGDDHPALADSYNNMGVLQMDRNDVAGALEMYERTLELDRRGLGEEHPFVAYDRMAIGVALGLLGRVDEAEATLRGALQDIRRVSGPDHPQTFNAMRELGILLQRADRCDEAQPLLEEALPGLERVFPGDPWQVATARQHLGICRANADPSAGEQLMRQAYERLVEVNGVDHRLTKAAREDLVAFLHARGRAAEVRELESAGSAVQ